MPESSPNTLTHYLTVLRRRRLLALAVFLLGPLLAGVYTLHQHRMYQGHSQVLVERQSVADLLTNNPSRASPSDFASVLQTQAELARSPEVARGAVGSGAPTDAPKAFLARSSVTPRTGTDLLDFNAKAPSRAEAVRLTNAYARAFAQYRGRLDTASLRTARADLDARLRALRTNGGPGSATVISNLSAKDQQLRTLEALQTANVAVVRKATDADLVQPRPLRNVLLGMLMGLLAALAVVLVVDAVDVRVRNESEIDSTLQIPLLARVPPPARAERGASLPIALSHPGSDQAEAFRVLRSNLEFVTIDSQIKTVVVTSASKGEGKSTTAANLAINLARVRDVVLVDLDLRAPRLAKLFGLEGRPGITNVLLGESSLEDALCEVSLPSGPGANSQSGARFGGALRVLTAGAIPPNAGSLVELPALYETIDRLTQEASIVLIDAPPMLGLGDTVAIASHVDAMLVVVRLGQVHRAPLRDMHRAIELSRARALGYIMTDARPSGPKAYGYGYGYGSAYARESDERSAATTGPGSART